MKLSYRLSPCRIPGLNYKLDNALLARADAEASYADEHAACLQLESALSEAQQDRAERECMVSLLQEVTGTAQVEEHRLEEARALQEQVAQQLANMRALLSEEREQRAQLEAKLHEEHQSIKLLKGTIEGKRVDAAFVVPAVVDALSLVSRLTDKVSYA